MLLIDQPLTPSFMLQIIVKIFLKAIVDTQTAFNTGKLNDSDGKPLSSSYPYKNLSNKADKDDMQEAYDLLQEIRVYIPEQFKFGNIIQQKNFLEFRQNWELKISGYLNQTRAKIINLINKALTRNKSFLKNKL